MVTRLHAYGDQATEGSGGRDDCHLYPLGWYGDGCYWEDGKRHYAYGYTMETSGSGSSLTNVTFV